MLVKILHFVFISNTCTGYWILDTGHGDMNEYRYLHLTFNFDENMQEFNEMVEFDTWTRTNKCRRVSIINVSWVTGITITTGWNFLLSEGDD